jgi:hypothetical protein
MVTDAEAPRIGHAEITSRGDCNDELNLVDWRKITACVDLVVVPQPA